MNIVWVFPFHQIGCRKISIENQNVVIPFRENYIINIDTVLDSCEYDKLHKFHKCHWFL